MRMKHNRSYVLISETQESNKNPVTYENTDAAGDNNVDYDINSKCDIMELCLNNETLISQENTNNISVQKDHQKPTKRKVNLNAQKTSEEKSPKISKRSTTPEIVPAVKISTPSTPLPVNDVIEEFLRRPPANDSSVRRKDYFAMLPDEVILIIFKFFSKPTLVSCACVCRRWKDIAFDNDLWPRIELSQRKIQPGIMAQILSRKPTVLRMSQTEVCSPIFKNVENTMETFVSKLEYLDMSMATIQPKDLQSLLRTCSGLLKLSVENCELNELVCKEIAKNTKLTVINMSQCTGLNDDCLKTILVNCKDLLELNIAWTSLKAVAIKCVCQFVPKSIIKINLSGCIKELTDSHVNALAIRCNKLEELDLSDASNITILSIQAICDNLKNLQVLSLSRCYSIYPSSYSRLFLLPSLTHLNIFGLFSENQIEALRKSCKVIINQMKFSSIARPTVGIRRTSIWGIRVRD